MALRAHWAFKEKTSSTWLIRSGYKKVAIATLVIFNRRLTYIGQLFPLRNFFCTDFRKIIAWVFKLILGD
jgi:hypothetical protein